MKRISLALDDTTYELILRETLSRTRTEPLTERAISKKAVQLIVSTVMEAFSSDVLPCTRCGKIISIEADEGSLREEGVFCNKHLPKEREE